MRFKTELLTTLDRGKIPCLITRVFSYSEPAWLWSGRNQAGFFDHGAFSPLLSVLASRV